MYAIYVNDRTAPFTSWLFDGQKLFETRTRDVFRSFLSRGIFEVAVIQTGKGKPVIIGTGTLLPPMVITDPDMFDGFRDACMIEPGSPFDMTGGKKYLYRFSPCTRFEVPVPVEDVLVKKHNRSFCEIEMEV